MNRGRAVVVALCALAVLGVVALLWWPGRGSVPPPHPAPAPSSATTATQGSTAARGALPDCALSELPREATDTVEVIHRGGPFRYVDTTGAASIVERMEELADRHGKRFLPAPLLVEAARSGKKFRR